MTLENKSFDKKLTDLNLKLEDIQKQIKATEAEKQDYINSLGQRKQKLLDNSVALEEVGLEVHDGIYFIVLKDDSFEYVIRLTKDQAEYLADDLDDQLTKEISKIQSDFSIVNDMLSGLFSGNK